MKASTITRILTPIVLASFISGCAVTANNDAAAPSSETSESADTEISEASAKEIADNIEQWLTQHDLG